MYFVDRSALGAIQHPHPCRRRGHRDGQRSWGDLVGAPPRHA